MSNPNASLLDALMGADRNTSQNEKPTPRMHYMDDNVCRAYLVDFCPNDLFVNTKSDKGPCHKIHDDGLKNDFQLKATTREKSRCQELFYEILQSWLQGLDKKYEEAQRRLKQPDTSLMNPNKDENEEKVVQIDEQIKILLEKACAFGEEGKVDEMEDVNIEIERLKAEIVKIENNEDMNPIFRQEKRMEICEVCGAYLLTGDNQTRTDTHLEGKQHKGYKLIRDKVQELKSSMQQEREREAEGKEGSPKRNRSPSDNHGHSRGGRNYRDREHQRSRHKYRRSDRDYRRPRSRSASPKSIGSNNSRR